jgi:hypothetical protein
MCLSNTVIAQELNGILFNPVEDMIHCVTLHLSSNSNFFFLSSLQAWAAHTSMAWWTGHASATGAGGRGPGGGGVLVGKLGVLNVESYILEYM